MGRGCAKICQKHPTSRSRNSAEACWNGSQTRSLKDAKRLLQHCFHQTEGGPSLQRMIHLANHKTKPTFDDVFWCLWWFVRLVWRPNNGSLWPNHVPGHLSLAIRNPKSDPALHLPDSFKGPERCRSNMSVTLYWLVVILQVSGCSPLFSLKYKQLWET